MYLVHGNKGSKRLLLYKKYQNLRLLSTFILLRGWTLFPRTVRVCVCFLDCILSIDCNPVIKVMQFVLIMLSLWRYVVLYINTGMNSHTATVRCSCDAWWGLIDECRMLAPGSRLWPCHQGTDPVSAVRCASVVWECLCEMETQTETTGGWELRPSAGTDSGELLHC